MRKPAKKFFHHLGSLNRFDEAEKKKLLKLIFFLAKLSALSLPLYLVIWLGLDLEWLRVLVAVQSTAFLKFFGFDVARNGSLLVLPNDVSIQITKDSTGWKSLLFLGALLLASPRSLKWKLFGLLLLLPAGWALNLWRIAGLAYAAIAGFGRIAHQVGWQLYSVGSVLLLWIAWLRQRIL